MEGDVATELAQRASGPVHLRLILQPLLAVLFAVKDGRKDAEKDAHPYISALLFKPGERRERIGEAWSSAGTVFCVAFILDCVFQYLTAGSIKALEALGIAIILCAVPYTVVRGPISRIARSKK